ncbi:O-antigen ligase family protein [Larsenimonas rhizosphaerae]|uniref:O-antigen ligase family protein n=1 Tax=Larsenimonas rhizosphaerae TaxID=2944682 RepID=A0AA42CUN0_9GAMM|nr:O-antigen ligase family protein [Larsenimonas rhizosphaerae]MCX2524857.1 O-antigen ligase family protein [Larsenimonas rhizosphaerae]
MPNRIALFMGPPPAHSPGWAYRIGLIATLLFLGCWSVLFEVSRQLEAVVLVMFIIGAVCTPARGRMARDPLLILLVIWLLLQCVTLPFAMAHFPAFADDQITSMRHLTKLFLVLPVAWFLYGHHLRTGLALGLFLMGMVMTALVYLTLHPQYWFQLTANNRPTLGFKNWEHAGVALGVVLIALSCLAPRFTGWLRHGEASTGWKSLSAALMIAAFGMSAFGVLLVKTRASWLGLILVIIISLMGLLITSLRKPAYRRRGLSLCALIIIAIGLLSVVLGPMLLTRMTAESGVIRHILQGDLTDIPMTSIGFRIHAWYYGIQTWLEHPWFGWGPKSHIPLLLESMHPVGQGTLGDIAAHKNLRHFHNSYLSLLIANGLAGTAVMAAAIGVIIRGALMAWRRGDMPTDILVFLVLFGVFWAVVNSFESYINYDTGYFMAAMTGGLAYSFHLRHRLESSR